MKKYLINEVSKVTGLSRATILYYEEKGLIKPSQESCSGYRKYSMKDINTIMFYQSLKNVGISVSEYVDVINQNHGDAYTDVYELVLRKKSIFLKKMLAYLSMWDETLAITYGLRSQKKIIRMQECRGTWTALFRDAKSGSKAGCFKELNNYFLSNGTACFFEKDKVLRGDDSFEGGLSCYEDCALPLPPEIKSVLGFKPPTMCVLEVTPFDIESGSFMEIIDEALEYARDRDFELSGDPWSHFGLRDEFNGVTTDYLTLWLPVSPGKHF